MLLMVWDAQHGLLGANPFKQAIHQSGQLALILLLLSLACTPARRWLGWKWTARIRRELGLLAFAYVTLHLGLHLADQGVNLSNLLDDIFKRPFITAGLLAFLLLLPLALTSTPRSIRRLGFMRWQRLHQLVYPAVMLATLHYWWSVKKDHTGPWLALTVLLVLLLLRWPRASKSKSR